ncbi:FMN reductase [Nocardiopsis terrae]|uniref:NAD(P)H-dependent FMN reductase n=1 Tax=Nocardiopsis terrae TaxID=372655 RepID=A0ABR9HE65_9ACTN|nr:NAD(P)H-dependent oxidoreductase [Nocardiopsis terrae]MBE1457326.1 NAD(P)H-dependent FMN reductase [Nocardiopsis terrae]GHC91758.1 FMN reductase [Nocardiopsis terrae]
MQRENLRIAVILGGNVSGRTGPVVSGWFLDLAASRAGVDVDALDVAEFDLGDGHGTPLGSFSSRIEAADGFVVVTPEYNHGYPGPLKSAIDSARKEWFAKPVAFVSYGGMSGGLRAVEQLRAVFAELHATTVRTSVSLHNAQRVFGTQGTAPEVLRDAEDAVGEMLDQLAWWALSLREARARRPYPG